MRETCHASLAFGKKVLATGTSCKLFCILEGALVKVGLKAYIWNPVRHDVCSFEDAELGSAAQGHIWKQVEADTTCTLRATMNAREHVRTCVSLFVSIPQAIVGRALGTTCDCVCVWVWVCAGYAVKLRRMRKSVYTN